MPLPEGSDWGTRLLAWAALILMSLLGAGFLWLLKRYIESNDASHKTTAEKLTKQSDANLQLEKKLIDETRKIETAATAMAKAQADFQSAISKELVEVHKLTAAIRTDLADGRISVETARKEVEKLAKTVETHQNTIQLSVRAIGQQKGEIEGIKTVIKKISDNLTIVGERKVTKGET